MLSTTAFHSCQHRGGTHLQKKGHTDYRAQLAKCVAYQRPFVLASKEPRYDQKFKDQVLAANHDRISLRGIKRIFGCATVPLQLSSGRSLPNAFVDTPLPTQNGEAFNT